jgi:hypothetical protein
MPPDIKIIKQKQKTLAKKLQFAKEYRNLSVA